MDKDKLLPIKVDDDELSERLIWLADPIPNSLPLRHPKLRPFNPLLFTSVLYPFGSRNAGNVAGNTRAGYRENSIAKAKLRFSSIHL